MQKQPGWYWNDEGPFKTKPDAFCFAIIALGSPTKTSKDVGLFYQICKTSSNQPKNFPKNVGLA
jgi:hypothetical protein